ncbi:hypothetical protein CW667_00020 [Candidatus Bathyarchaeota archaeon]|nr:MAG: hypothetical protein CW667_00020 [Candidatus Bathyarchaeota archaeon]
MKRIYADLHLCPNLNNERQTARMIRKAAALGYRLIAIPVPLSLTEKKVRWLRNLCEEVGIEFASRIDLKPRTPRELIVNLRRLRRRFEIIAVLCETKQVARQAAKDRRVDLLNFPAINFRRRFFDKAEAELASSGLTAFEIDVKPLIMFEGAARVRLMSNLRKEVAIAQKFRVPTIVSSGVSDELHMRKPRELAALASLFDLKETAALEAVSKNPVAIVKRNREKLSPRFVAPGIRVIRRGKDC